MPAEFRKIISPRFGKKAETHEREGERTRKIGREAEKARQERAYWKNREPSRFSALVSCALPKPPTPPPSAEGCPFVLWLSIVPHRAQTIPSSRPGMLRTRADNRSDAAGVVRARETLPPPSPSPLPRVSTHSRRSFSREASIARRSARG